MNSLLQAVSVDGKDIQKLIFDKLAPACEGEKISHSVLGMLTFSALLLKPEITLDELQDLVMSTSEYMVMQLSTVTGEAN